MANREQRIGDRLRVPTGAPVNLSAQDTRDTGGVGRKKAEKGLADDTLRLADLQERLFAEGKSSLLLILQGLDASGKDGTIKHVMSAVNPQGVDVSTFKRPTPAEQRHDFLWRVRKRLPAPGRIGIFNRSHYEDVLVRVAHDDIDEATLERRYKAINAFEAEIAARGTRLVKVMLHISYDEQRDRLLDRLRRPDKRWKFNPSDLQERALWDRYMSAYSRAVEACSESAPWYVVPADRKWYRNWAIGGLVVEALEGLDPRYPQPELDIPALVAELRAS